MLCLEEIRCADRVLKDSHPHPTERLTFSGIVATSSNVGTILATQYASNVAPVLDTLPPAFPDAGKEAASESIIATVAVLGQASAEGLPASTVASVQAGAFDAFLSATHVTSIISLVVVGIAAIIVGFFLPHISPPTAAMERGLGPKPVDPADELIHDETESYGREVDAEYVEKPGPADA